MHLHWEHWLWAVIGFIFTAITSLAYFMRQIDQIVESANKWRDRMRERVNASEAHEKKIPPLGDSIASGRPVSSSNKVILSALIGECRFLCCTSGEWDRFITSTIEVAVQVSQSMLGNEAIKEPMGNGDHKESTQAIRDFVLGIYAEVHRVWLVDYHDLSDSGRWAGFFKLLFARALKRRKCSHRTAVIVAQHLSARKIRKIATPRPRSDHAGHANIVICDMIGQVINRLSDRECLIFLYRVFAEFSEDEVVELTGLKHKTVRAKSRKSMNMLSRIAMRQVKVDHELLAILREAARREGTTI